MTLVGISNICSAFGNVAIGTKVLPNKQLEAMSAIVACIERSIFQENGQAVLDCPELIPFVRSGDAPKSNRVEDYVLRSYRGEVQKYIKGHLAESVAVKTCKIVLYTKDAYLLDPDVAGDPIAEIARDEEEYSRIRNSNYTHVLVAILASGSNESAVSPHRFVMNLAGGNNDYKTMTADDLRSLALKVKKAYANSWQSVSD